MTRGRLSIRRVVPTRAAIRIRASVPGGGYVGQRAEVRGGDLEVVEVDQLAGAELGACSVERGGQAVLGGALCRAQGCG